MKIGVDAREFVATGKTGISRYLENLLTPLVGRPEWDLILFVPRGEFVPAGLCRPQVKAVTLPPWPTLLVDQVSLPSLAQRAAVDVFFSPYYKVPLTGRFQRIITVHDIMFLRRNELAPWRRHLIAIQLRAALGKADVILVPSDFTGCDLVNFEPRCQGKLHRFNFDLTEQWLSPPKPDTVAKIRQHYSNGKRFLLYVGNFRPHKNVDLLVQAFAGLVKACLAADWRLLLIGGDQENSLRITTLIAKQGLAEQILVYPNVNDGDLRGLYAAADWFITASGYEGFGFPLLEAMACGCPVICHLNTAIPEMVGKAALEISSLTVEGVGAALHQACRLAAAAKKEFVEKGFRQASRFAPGTAAAGFSALLATLRG
ncbi:MAG: glycosyltransferase family 4 protein [Lentisphaerae bacterium]|nr:glycosyltransferase family 4 protein [Lentisphaerota bacterium]